MSIVKMYMSYLYVIMSLINVLNAQKLLVFFLDGFRWDYLLNNKNLQGFKEIMQNGVYVEKVTPVFPADCYPNIYSLFTGLYPRYHGVLSNQVYSTSKKTLFDHKNPSHRRSVHKWISAEPLWVTAKKQNKSSFLYHLPICDNSKDLLSPSYCVPYQDQYMELGMFNRSVSEALAHLNHGLVDIAVVYNDQLDRVTHRYGPESFHLSSTLLPTFDSIIRSTLRQLSRDAYDQGKSVTDVHLVIVSDHGMHSIARANQINLEHIILRSQIERVVNQGGFAAIWARPGQYLKVLYRLRVAASKDANFKLYTGKNVPREWQVHGHELSPQILLVAFPGFFISSKELKFPEGENFYNSGWHGYSPDTDSMASTLLAIGPRLKRRVRMSRMHITDVYSLLTEMAGLKALPHNGSDFTKYALLKSYSTNQCASNTVSSDTLFVIFLSGIFLKYAFCCC